MSSRAWITLATNDSYGLGALVLASSLRRANSAYPAVVLITPSVTDAMRDRLSAVFAEVVTVNVLDSQDATHLALLQRPELGITFTKIHCWSLVQYEKCVFLDADTLIVQNCDELFEREELSAAPDVGWPDCFNSGVFVFKPSQETFEKLIKFAQERGSFDGGDQGLLNSFFSDWARGDINKHLPFLYNVTSAAFYSYLPAMKHYGQDLKIIHFIGATKPWLQRYNWTSNTVDAPDHLKQFLQLWWDLFISQVHSQLDTSMVEPEEASASLLPQDVFKYYEPTIDPNSEFPWHHADNQNDDDDSKLQEIDLSEFFDPWQYFRGNIPPFWEDVTSYSGYKSEANDPIQQYWEYCSNPNQSKDYQSDQHWLGSQHSHKHEHQPWHNEEQPLWQQNQCTYLQNQPWNTEHTYHNDHTYKSQTDPYEYHCTQIETHGLQNQWQPYNNDEHHNQSNQTDDHDKHTNQDCQHHFSQNQTSYFDDVQKHNHSDWNHFSQPKSQSEIEHHSHMSPHIHQQIHSDDSQNQHNKFHNISDDYHQPIDQNLNTNTSNHSNIQIEAQRPHQTTYNKEKECIECEHSKAHACIEDEEEDEYFEEIKPRHPYDGFYLRHIPTIDSRGRKICIHELPPSPSPSPPPESPPPLEATNVNGIDDQSGVAGNFARVAPGSSGFQTEAVDELTRRQGWEAGNMDYMGADSFDNIWAKISQTLNQPRASPPRQPPPKEPSPPKQPSPPKEQSTVEESQQETPAPVAVESLTEVTAVAEASPVTDSVASDNAVIPTDVEGSTAVLTDPVNEVSKDAANVPASETPIICDTPVASELVKVVEAPVTTEVAPPSEAVTVVESSESVNVPQPAKTVSAAEVPSVELPSTTEDVKDSQAPASEISPPPTEDNSTGEAPVLEDSIPVNVPINVVKAPVLSESLPVAQDINAGESPAPVESSLATSAVKTDELTSTLAESLNATIEAPLATEAPAAVVTSAPLEAIPLAEPTKTAISEPAALEAAPVSKDEPKPTLKEDIKEKTECKSVVEAPKEVLPITPEKNVESTASDSPPLAHTPSKEERPIVPAAQSEERRKPLGKLLLSPPTAADPLPTPDSELEDAASLAQSIIASELRTPTVSSPSPSAAPTSPPHLKQEKRLSVDEPEVPTPPVTTPVSLAQIGVKPKGKSSIASRIESSITEPEEVVATVTASKASTAPSTQSDASKKPSPKSAEPVIPASTKPAATKTSVTSAPSEGGKKKLEKKGSKESATGSEAPMPVPPPRKKEKKPKEK